MQTTHRVIQCQSLAEFTDQAHVVIQEKIQAHRAKLVFLPSGGTPISIYKKWETEKPPFLQGLEFTQLDEILEGPLQGSFEAFFKRHLPTYFEKFTPLKQQTRNPDVAVLGLGPNGHVAFHEPGVALNFYKGVVELTEDTCRRIQQPTGLRALTYGVSCFLQAKSIVMLIQGKDKERVTKEFIENPVAHFPAAALRTHPDLTTIYLPAGL